jgi:hypothetical protein
VNLFRLFHHWPELLFVITAGFVVGCVMYWLSR